MATADVDWETSHLGDKLWVNANSRACFTRELFASFVCTELYTPKPSNFAPRPRQNQPLAVRMGEKLELRYYADLTPTRSYTEENISNPPPRIE